MCDFQARDLVECIDGSPVLQQSRAMPELGQRYYVESVRKVGDGYSVRLFEVLPECYLGGPCTCGNCGWDAARFRLVRRFSRDKLGVLRDLLENTPEKEAVRADA